MSPRAAGEALRAHAGWVVVSGDFDPLTAAHARRLRAIRAEHDGIVVFLSDPPDPVLPPGARAELVAALGSVNAVVLPSPGRVVEVAAGVRVYDERDADRSRFRELVKRVHVRCDMVLER